MPIIQATQETEGHVRFVFADSEVTYPLADDATFQDVAVTLHSLSDKEHGDLLSIFLVLNSEEDDPENSMPDHLSQELDSGSKDLQV